MNPVTWGEPIETNIDRRDDREIGGGPKRSAPTFGFYELFLRLLLVSQMPNSALEPARWEKFAECRSPPSGAA
jgi:hypothetical protein